MNSFTDNNKTLEAYLYHQLPDKQLAALEDELLRDADLFDRLQAVEMNLIDRYLEDEMSAAERELFEVNYLRSPANEWKVEEARLFRQSLELAQKKESLSGNVVQFPVVNKLSANSVRLQQYAAAAVILILLAIFVGWLLYRQPRPNTNTYSTSAQHPPTPGPTSTGTNNTPEQPSPSPAVSPSTIKPDPVKEEWLFLRDERTGVMGSGDDLHLAISPETKTLRLRFELLDDARNRDSFLVSIKDPMGYPLFPSPGTVEVKAAPVRYRGTSRRAISIDIAVASLKVGERYRFEIAEPYAQRTFLVAKSIHR